MRSSFFIHFSDEVPSNGICTGDENVNLHDGQEHVVAAFNLVKKDVEIHEMHYKRAWGNLLYNHTKIKSAKDLHIFYHLGIRAASYYGLQVPKPTSGKYSSEGAAREWSIVVDISIPPPSFKPVSFS